MGFFRTAALMIVGWVAIKMMKRAIENIEAQQVKAKVKPEKSVKDLPRLKLDPITGVYVPEA
jgi:hypothetical protein